MPLGISVGMRTAVLLQVVAYDAEKPLQIQQRVELLRMRVEVPGIKRFRWRRKLSKDVLPLPHLNTDFLVFRSAVHILFALFRASSNSASVAVMVTFRCSPAVLYLMGSQHSWHPEAFPPGGEADGEQIVAIDANFGLVRKTSSGVSSAPPLQGTTMFLDDNEVKEFLNKYNDEGKPPEYRNNLLSQCRSPHIVSFTKTEACNRFFENLKTQAKHLQQGRTKLVGEIKKRTSRRDRKLDHRPKALKVKKSYNQQLKLKLQHVLKEYMLLDDCDTDDNGEKYL
uniref:Uncharacterized protein n=1 Tax=Branchiostoma floridae TaxID=7739 RepID=C3Z178_BRAFL|eukprot:XP_002597765.1 hypothetical protein BRAFLDRAFT_77332 [Branchiostoma floridae]